MSLITASNLTKSYGARDIFTGLSFGIEKGARLGIVGPNGVGKTSLLRILAGVDEASSGSLHCTRGARIGYLSHEADFQLAVRTSGAIVTAFSSGPDPSGAPPDLHH